MKKIIIYLFILLIFISNIFSDSTYLYYNSGVYKPFIIQKIWGDYDIIYMGSNLIPQDSFYLGFRYDYPIMDAESACSNYCFDYVTNLIWDTLKAEEGHFFQNDTYPYNSSVMILDTSKLHIGRAMYNLEDTMIRYRYSISNPYIIEFKTDTNELQHILYSTLDNNEIFDSINDINLPIQEYVLKISNESPSDTQIIIGYFMCNFMRHYSSDNVQNIYKLCGYYAQYAVIQDYFYSTDSLIRHMVGRSDTFIDTSTYNDSCLFTILSCSHNNNLKDFFNNGVSGYGLFLSTFNLKKYPVYIVINPNTYVYVKFRVTYIPNRYFFPRVNLTSTQTDYISLWRLMTHEYYTTEVPQTVFNDYVESTKLNYLMRHNDIIFTYKKLYYAENDTLIGSFSAKDTLIY